jgi:hypothetical protein
MFKKNNDPYRTKKRPCIILCFAIPGNVYPVTEEYDGPDTLLGNKERGRGKVRIA